MQHQFIAVQLLTAATTVQKAQVWYLYFLGVMMVPVLWYSRLGQSACFVILELLLSALNQDTPPQDQPLQQLPGGLDGDAPPTGQPLELVRLASLVSVQTGCA